MTTLQWDRTLLMPAEAGVFLTPFNTSGGIAADGSEQVIGNSPGRWTATYNQIGLNSTAKILRWNEIAALLEGRLTPILIPVLDRQRAPLPPATASMVGAVAANAVTCSIKVLAGGGVLVPGMHWSVNERLYRLRTVGAATGGGDKTYPVSFRPTCREPIADGTALEFNDPWFRVKLVADDGMKTVYQALRFASPSVEFREDL